MLTKSLSNIWSRRTSSCVFRDSMLKNAFLLFPPAAPFPAACSLKASRNLSRPSAFLIVPFTAAVSFAAALYVGRPAAASKNAFEMSAWVLALSTSLATEVMIRFAASRAATALRGLRAISTTREANSFFVAPTPTAQPQPLPTAPHACMSMPASWNPLAVFFSIPSFSVIFMFVGSDARRNSWKRSCSPNCSSSSCLFPCVSGSASAAAPAWLRGFIAFLLRALRRLRGAPADDLDLPATSAPIVVEKRLTYKKFRTFASTFCQRNAAATAPSAAAAASPPAELAGATTASSPPVVVMSQSATHFSSLSRRVKSWWAFSLVPRPKYCTRSLARGMSST
mmetsp:Transcript_28885/g.73056  ORF Transcript_28885/g.73056 Transcript_28885/m.73056 type:complete len:339 (-) Transcript_28885:346-1362(-)